MYPTTYEEQILRVFVTYHYLTVDQVMLATGHPSYRNTARRLKNLTDAGYLWRIHRRTTEQNLPLKPAYTISAKIKKYLEEQGNIVLPPREPSPYTLDHSLAINDVLIRVFRLNLSDPNRFKLIHLFHDRDLRIKNLQLPLVPDGFFELADLERKRSFPTLLEVDLATEERVRWQEKIEKYLEIFGKEAERVFDFRHPDVLCVTKPNHIAELKTWTNAVIKRKNYDGHERLFYFTALPKNETAEEYFLTNRFIRGDTDEPVCLFSR